VFLDGYDVCGVQVPFPAYQAIFGGLQILTVLNQHSLAEVLLHSGITRNKRWGSGNHRDSRDEGCAGITRHYRASGRSGNHRGASGMSRDAVGVSLGVVGLCLEDEGGRSEDGRGIFTDDENLTLDARVADE
jgi:hypothetical protein